MRRLTRADLRSLEDYELVRAEFRQRIAAALGYSPRAQGATAHGEHRA